MATSVTTPAPRVGRPEGPPAGRPSTPAPAPAPAPPAGSGAARRAAEAPLGWIEQVAGMMVLTGKAMVATFTPPYSWRDEFIQESWLILRRCLVPMVFSVFVFSFGAPGMQATNITAIFGTVDRMGAFAYSPQEGTRAMQYEDDVEEGVKRDRLEEIVEVQRVISGERLARFVGRQVDVLVDRLEEEEGIKVGRVQWQADDVDGVTYLERGGWTQPGGFVRARITASEDYDFQAAALT